MKPGAAVKRFVKGLLTIAYQSRVVLKVAYLALKHLTGFFDDIVKELPGQLGNDDDDGPEDDATDEPPAVKPEVEE